MLDIQLIREKPDQVQEKAKQKGYDVDIKQLLGFDSKRRELLAQVEDLRQKRNQLTASSKGQKPNQQQVVQGRELKIKLTDLEHQLSSVEQEYQALLRQVPNLPLDNVPVGANETENVVVRTVGEPHPFDFEPRNHWELMQMTGQLDKIRAAKVAGSRFAYLIGDVVSLQFALVQFVINTLTDQATVEKLISDNNLELKPTPFKAVLPPALIKTRPYLASGRLNAEEVTYKLASDDLWLNASAEHSLCTLYMDEILSEEELPIRYLGYSTSFRREAGTYGKDTEGLIRMHQFDKLELEVFSTPETGLREHQLLIVVQEYLINQLKLPYQYIQKCTADIGMPNANGVDLNCWFPGQKRYIETHTADFMSDYQARALNTKLRRPSGDLELVHTNDATAFALGRTLAAIVENYQDKDGSIWVPEVLKSYLGNREKL